MKKIFAINGSPRNNGNTAVILQEVLAGAASAGVETELLNLGTLHFSGCRSCFACKLKRGKCYGKCAVQDELTPWLEKIIQADAIVMGTPIYFGAETGLYRNFLERLFFPLLRYTNPPSSCAPKKLEAAFVYTMNVNEETMEQYGYRDFLEKGMKFPQMILGSSNVESLYVFDTYQFDDYDKYESSLFDPQHKAEVRNTRFPEDKKRAFALGKRLAERI